MEAMTSKKRSLVLLVTGLLAVGCQSSDPDILAESDGYTNTAITNTGSDNLQPPGLIEDRHEDFVVPNPPSSDWPELSREDLAELERGMTRDELLELLGRPVRKETAVQAVDHSPEEDWNAEVYTWKYRDSSITAGELVRDLEVRLAYVYRNRPVPGRDDVVGPAWVVVGWDLF